MAVLAIVSVLFFCGLLQDILISSGLSVGLETWPSSPVSEDVGMAVGLRCRYFISENVRGTGTFRWSGPAVEAGRVHYKNRPGVSMLKISNSHKDDNGTYTCTYEPTGEQARIDLIIIVPPSVEAPENQTITAGMNHEISGLVMCTINPGNPPVLSSFIKWYKDDVLLSGDRYNFDFDSGLTIQQIKPEDSGTYSCVVEDTGTFSVDIKVTVVNPTEKTPKINESRVGFHKNLNCEESLQLVCYLAEDSEPADIIWKKPDPGPDVVFLPGKTLHVSHPVTPGVYECIATNDFGRDTHSVVVISKAPAMPPRLDIDSVAIVHSGDPLEVSCQPASAPYGFPLPRLDWKHTGSNLPVTNDSSQRVYVSTTHSLVFKSVEEGDPGAFSCVASYVCGVEAKAVQIILEPPLDTNICLQISSTECENSAAMVRRLSRRIKLTVQGFCSDCNIRVGNTYLDCSTGQFTASISIHEDLVNLLYDRLSMIYEDMKKCNMIPTTPKPQTAPPAVVAPVVILSVIIIALVIALLLGLLFYCKKRRNSDHINDRETASTLQTDTYSISSPAYTPHTVTPIVVRMENGQQTHYIRSLDPTHEQYSHLTHPPPPYLPRTSSQSA